MCVDPLTPVVFEMEYSGITQELYVLFRLGFHTSQRSATVKFHTWTEPASSEPARSVVETVQNTICPSAYVNRVQALGYEYGSWSFGIDEAVPFPSTTTINDYGMRFWQGPTTTTQLAALRSIGVYRVRYIYGYENQQYDFTAAQISSQAAIIAETERRAATGDLIAQASLNAGVFASDGSRICYVYAYTQRPQFVPNGSPNILPSPNHFDAEFVHWQSDLLTNRNGIMIDNNPYFYWQRMAPVGQRTRMNYREDHFQYMETPLSFDTTFKVGINYEMMAVEFVKACADWCKEQSEFQIVHCNGGITATNFTYAHQDSCGWESVAHYTDGRWSPTDYEYLIHHRIKVGKKHVMTIMNPQEWSTWTNTMTRKILARFCSFGILPSMGRAAENWDNTEGGTSFFKTTLVDRDRALFKQYVPITRALAHAGWRPKRNFTLSNSTIWGERFGDKADAAKTVYITCFNPSTTTNVTFTLSSSIYSVPAPSTFTELLSNTSRSWTAGNLTITLGPETVQVFRLTYP
jgi:hypothetical protein